MIQSACRVHNVGGIMVRRKDSNGRVLKEGETQRKDGLYQFRYTDITGKRKTLYASTLAELREKEAEAQNNPTSETTVYSVAEKYLMIKTNLKPSSVYIYTEIMKFLKTQEIMQESITDIRTSDAKLWMSDLVSSGRSVAYVTLIKKILKPAFEMAIEDRMINFNPFAFTTRFLAKKHIEKEALTPDQQQRLFTFIKESPFYSGYFNELAFMLHTGVRVGEMSGLTLDEIDLDQGVINIRHQLRTEGKDRASVVPPKTKTSVRTIPLSDVAKACLLKMLSERDFSHVNPSVDGYSGFVNINERGKPRTTDSYRKIVSNICNAYNKKYNENLYITPHILRHTFCTNLLRDGVGVSTVQYIMGHADPQMTLKIYTHIKSEDAIAEFKKVSSVVTSSPVFIFSDTESTTPILHQFA